MSRSASIERNTKETQIKLAINLDGTGECELNTPIPFLNHMLEQISRHGLIDLNIDAKGDVDIDDHHTVEDIGICLGEVLREAIGDKKGIVRHTGLPRLGRRTRGAQRHVQAGQVGRDDRSHHG